jgi:hypothetical protein
MTALDHIRAGSLALRDLIMAPDREAVARELACQWAERHPEELIDLLFATPEHDLLRAVGNLRERVHAAVERAEVFS